MPRIEYTAADYEEYDSAAMWCAKRDLRGVDGDPLPQGLSAKVSALIADDVEAFQERVRLSAYAWAMRDVPDYS